ncbi:acetate--CoA ligase family protein [Pseudonocardia sp. KRD-184]|uniref:Acetate--CoA ligase family protein n=1 Tax=Pseudonocardia oceani TaxID=2792013 RepID=A0ABS6U2M3_9PSEU|nr:acetate--CoA ligase family protein [Pseudonocardia oceani]MBW0088867.1 acetate--CoA ligase family protein [Pseudonocardia oceani]MBW0095099.1 acetate--CoA ligase family protein [Pseudonocardia oceani]MBW0107203.1 acetate--CoA ligase family protein [Pseudonocardia oceani]MBW0119701.1 acetate--CoA ligase family protein [Pseudonocardia oceani]MBW0126364.1 acetate--CoA ligase family protein [Pseudonocardia oceani]
MTADAAAAAPTGRELLRCLLRPESVALFGASPDPARPATRALRSLLRGARPPRLYPVNPRHTAVAGVVCLPDAAALPEVPDLTVVAVRAESVLDTVAAAADRGARTFLVFSSGFAELDDAGAARERGLAALARERGLAVVGPNSLGVIDFGSRSYCTFASLVDGEAELPAGAVALVTQSGAIGSYVAAMAHAGGFGLALMVSTGNEAVLDAARLACAVLDDPGVRAVALYLEGVRDGAGLTAFFAAARDRGVPVVLLRAGDSERGQAAARSHTGALAGSARVSDAVLRRYGVVGVTTPEDLVTACRAVVAEPPWGGRRIGVLTGSGGGGVLVSDACDRWGLTVPPLRPGTTARLRELLPAWASAANPVDVTATVLIDPRSPFDRCLRVLAGDDAVDEVVVFLGGGGSFGPGLARRIVAAATVLGKRCSVIWLGASAEVAEILHAGGVAVFGGIEECIRPLAALAAAAEPHPATEVDPATEGDQAEPSPAALIRFLDAQHHRVLDEDASKTLLELAGVTGLPARRVLAPAEVAAGEDPGLGFPLAVKVLARDIAHKSAVGGVVVGVADAAGLRAAARQVFAAGVAAVGAAGVQGVLVERMAPPGVEVIVGVATDPVYGRVLAVGPGGVLAELVDDVTIVLPPASPGAVRRSLEGTRLIRLLAGADTGALCALVARLSRLVAGGLPGVAEIDLNPVLVHPYGHGVSVVDGLVALDHARER